MNAPREPETSNLLLARTFPATSTFDSIGIDDYTINLIHFSTYLLTLGLAAIDEAPDNPLTERPPTDGQSLLSQIGTSGEYVRRCE